MGTRDLWVKRIEEACAEPDPARCNRLITELHFALSEALAEAVGRQAGPNFHSWAVWGSRKAGFTIRQEDLDSAIVNAAMTAGVTGSAVGATAGLLFRSLAPWLPEYFSASAGAVVGSLAGGWTGRRLAIWSRKKAAHLVLDGNRTVLRDIGEQSARFLELLEAGASSQARAKFFAGLRPGRTEELGQDRLGVAFQHYLDALDAPDLTTKQSAMVAGNCAIVYHEHIRLEPYIHGAMPLIVRRCATERMMTYEVGEIVLAVGKNVPGAQTVTAAKNWANLDQRMRYVFALFRQFHGTPEVFSRPYSAIQR